MAEARDSIAGGAPPCGLYLLHHDRQVVAVGMIAIAPADPETYWACCEVLTPYADFSTYVHASNVLTRIAARSRGARRVKLRHGLARLGTRRNHPLDLTVRLGARVRDEDDTPHRAALGYGDA